MISRRTLLTTLAALPLCGWLRPKERESFRLPVAPESAIESLSYLDGNGNSVELKIHRFCGRVYLTPELAADWEPGMRMIQADFDAAYKESFGAH